MEGQKQMAHAHAQMALARGMHEQSDADKSLQHTAWSELFRRLTRRMLGLPFKPAGYVDFST